MSDISIHRVRNITIRHDKRRDEPPHYDVVTLDVVNDRWAGPGMVNVTEKIRLFLYEPNDRLERAVQAFNAIMAEPPVEIAAEPVEEAAE